MTLPTYYLLAMSVAATLFSIGIIIWIVVMIWGAMRLKQIMLRIEKITDTTHEMTLSVKDFVQATTNRLETAERMFLTAQGLKELGTSIADAIKGKHKST